MFIDGTQRFRHAAWHKALQNAMRSGHYRLSHSSADADVRTNNWSSGAETRKNSKFGILVLLLLSLLASCHIITYQWNRKTSLCQSIKAPLVDCSVPKTQRVACCKAACQLSYWCAKLEAFNPSIYICSFTVSLEMISFRHATIYIQFYIWQMRNLRFVQHTVSALLRQIFIINFKKHVSLLRSSF